MPRISYLDMETIGESGPEFLINGRIKGRDFQPIPEQIAIAQQWVTDFFMFNGQPSSVRRALRTVAAERIIADREKGLDATYGPGGVPLIEIDLLHSFSDRVIQQSGLEDLDSLKTQIRPLALRVGDVAAAAGVDTTTEQVSDYGALDGSNPTFWTQGHAFAYMLESRGDLDGSDPVRTIYLGALESGFASGL